MKNVFIQIDSTTLKIDKRNVLKEEEEERKTNGDTHNLYVE